MDDPNASPLSKLDKEGPGSRPGDASDTDIQRPGDTDKDLTQPFPDTDNRAPGRRDENITENEEMYD